MHAPMSDPESCSARSGAVTLSYTQYLVQPQTLTSGAGARGSALSAVGMSGR